MLKFRFFAFLALLAVKCSAQLTSFTYALYNADGSPATNPVTLFPVQVNNQNTITLAGTSVIFPTPVILNPGASNAGTNSLEPGSYQGKMTTAYGSTVYFYVNVPATAAVLPWTAYISGAPAMYPPSSLYAFMTNALGGPAGLIQALGFQPATNSIAGITNVLGLNALTNLFGLNALTNLLGLNGLTNLVGLGGATNLVGLNGVTNLMGLNGLTNLAGLNSVTNLIGLNGVTNLVGLNAVTNLSGLNGVTNLLGGVYAWATPAGVTNALGLAVLPPWTIWTTNTPMLSPGVTTYNGVTNAWTTNSSQLVSETIGWTNLTFPQFTGILGYTNSGGTASRLYITNGIIVTNTTP